jgi:UDP-2,3-diacylglucosamine pyrophosphatase LpxH
MSQDKKLTEKRLSALWKDPKVKQLPLENNKLVMFSDLHLGDGGKADDFRESEPALAAALDHYEKKGFTVILLGDIEELWQFDLHKISERYKSSVYRRLQRFDNQHFHRVFGNHDSEWGVPADPARKNPRRSAAASEAIKLVDKTGKPRILLVHGNQGSIESDKTAWFSRFAVRLYKAIEPIFKIDRHRSATKSQIAGDYERILYSWAKKNRVMLICGHSHRAIFRSRSYIEILEEKIRTRQKEIQNNPGNRRLIDRNLREIERLHKEKLEELKKNRGIVGVEDRKKPLPCYFNTGCGLYTDGLTAVEIEKDSIRLVKWSKRSNPGGRRVFDQDSLSAFLQQIARSR